jgi:hypothetical protein
MYKRLTVYPNGAKIPESLPDSYQPSSYGNAPPGQSCFTCTNFNLATRYCSAWKAPVKPRWWCEGWAPIMMIKSTQSPSTLVKKITTSTVEEHFSEMPKSTLKATQLDYGNEYGYGYENDYEDEDETENEEDVITLNVPLMIRLLEYAREDANKDVDLHIIAENLVDLSEEGDVLEMKDYPEIVKIESED